MKKYTYTEIKDILKENSVVTVFFTKLNGESRVLQATLSPDLIPEEHRPTGNTPRIQSEDAVCVYDVENEGWRAFRVDGITNIEVPTLVESETEAKTETQTEVVFVD